MKTFWLSFSDPHRPKGTQFLGVAIIDVTDADAARAVEHMRSRFPHARAGAEWIAAASRRAWETGCNPGGEMMSIDVTGAHEIARTPRNTLLSEADLRDLDIGVRL